MALDWKELIAPGAIVGLGGFAFMLLSGDIDTVDGRLIALDQKVDRRIESIERRFAETNQRIDRMLEQQAKLIGQFSQAETQIIYIRNRLDKIAEKLQVASADPADSPFKKADFVAFADGLTDTQAVAVWNLIKSTPGAPSIEGLVATKGLKVPEGARLEKLPVKVLSIQPAWQDYQFTWAKNGVAIVDPTSRTIQSVVYVR